MSGKFDLKQTASSMSLFKLKTGNGQTTAASERSESTSPAEYGNGPVKPIGPIAMIQDAF
jgi:uncharacterized protein YegP (UPF0339 family)